MLIDSLHHQIKLPYCVCFDFYDLYFYLLRKVEDAKTNRGLSPPKISGGLLCHGLQPNIIVISVCKSLYDNSPIIYQSDLIIKSHDNIIIMMHQSSTLLMMIDNCYQSINYSLLIATFKHYSLVLWKSAKKYHFLLLECLIYWFHNGMFFLDNFDFVCNTF